MKTKLVEYIKKLVREEIKTKLHENSVAFKKFAITDSDEIESFKYYHDHDVDEFNNFLKKTTDNFKNKADAIKAWKKDIYRTNYAKPHVVQKYVLTKKPKTKEEIVKYIHDYLKMAKQKFGVDYEDYNMNMNSVMSAVANKLKIDLSSVMSKADFKKQTNKEPEVRYKWKSYVGDPGTGYFEYTVTKVDGDKVYYKTDSSNVRILDINDVI